MRNDILVACDYNELIMHTPVLNLMSLGKFVYVQIPAHLRNHQLYEMYDISGKESLEVNCYGKAIKDPDHPWVQIPLEILGLRSGKHTYRIDLIDSSTCDICSTFISYISQDDNPETPYVYMSDRGNTDSDSNAWKDGSYADKSAYDPDATYEYDPLLMGQEVTTMCATCTRDTCVDCPYRIEEV